MVRESWFSQNYAGINRSSAWLIVLPNFSSFTTCFALCCLLSYFILHCSVFKVPAFQPFSRPDRNICSQVLRSILDLLWKFFLLPFSFKKKEVVGPSGLEPPTSRLSVVRSNQLSYGPSSSQTSHPSLPSYAESSLAPSLLLFGPNPLRWALARYREHLVEVTGLEPVAPCLQSRCSTAELNPHQGVYPLN